MAGTVDWYGEDVLAVIEGATDELLDQLAFQVEGEIKVAITFAPAVDTGFMRNAVYTITTAAKTLFGGKAGKGKRSGSYKSDKTGQMVERKRVDTVPRIPPHTSAVHAAAEYTLDQEMKHQFMYNGLQKGIRAVGGVLKAVRRRRGL